MAGATLEDLLKELDQDLIQTKSQTGDKELDSLLSDLDDLKYNNPEEEILRVGLHQCTMHQ